MPPTNLTLAATSDHNLVAVEVSSQRTVEWVINATAAAAQPNRSPLNIALIIDRSGSMHGDKLAHVQQATCHVLDQLDARDQVALVAYDDQVQLLAPSTHVDQQARDTLKAQINALYPGGWTDLSGGWLAGCREVAAHLHARAVSRALLLTDGLANRGITDLEELMHHARELRQRGVATSAFGVGLDFNEHLLEALAEQGGGHFYYIAQPGQIPDVFRHELGELLAVVAREAVLTLKIPAGIAAEVLGGVAHERNGERLRIFLGDLSAGEQRAIYTRVLTPPDALGTWLVLRGELGYANLDGQIVQIATDLAFSYVRETEVRRVPVAEDVLLRASMVELADAATAALKLERAGQRHQAQALLNATLAAAPAMPASTAASYAALAGRMADGLSEADRKQTHFAAYRARHGDI